MPAALDRPHHRRLLRDALDLPNRARRARVFHLPGGDLAVATAPGDSLRPAVLRALDGALDPAGADDLLRIRRLPEEAASLLAALEESLGLFPPPAPPPPGPAALDSEGLEALLAALAGAEVEPFLRRQHVCRVAPEEDAEPVAESVRPWPEALRDRLLPGRDLSAAPALARRLRLGLEERLLATLAGPEWRARPRPLELGVSVPALTSDAFMRLDAALPAALRPLLTFGVPTGDVLADPAGFALGRDLVLSRGYGLALEAPNALALALLPPADLGVTAIRLAWSDALPGEDAAIPRSPPVTLTGADRAVAIAWAWECGITRFQGRAPDRWMRAGSRAAA
jgi:hypothetical protein